MSKIANVTTWKPKTKYVAMSYLQTYRIFSIKRPRRLFKIRQF